MKVDQNHDVSTKTSWRKCLVFMYLFRPILYHYAVTDEQNEATK